MRKITRKNKNLLKILLISAVLFAVFLMPFISYAQEDENCSIFSPTCLAEKIFITFTNFTFNIVFTFLGHFINLAAAFIQQLIAMGGEVMQSETVLTGFRITLAIANLGFVLVIIVIAFATMLRLEGYETKKLLKNLIIAAVLINFSLTIAGTIIDFNNLLGNFFIGKITNNNVDNFAASMANSLNLNKVNEVKSATGAIGKISEFSEGFLKFLLSFLLAIVLIGFIALVFWGLALMLLFRYLWLVFLLILMPLVWLLWTIPRLSNYWKLWWNRFLQWNFFLPAVSFFLYLAIATADKLPKTSPSNTPSLALEENILQDLGVPGILNAIVRVGLFAGALLVGNALGIKGASGALDGMIGIKNWAIDAATRPFKKAGKALYQAPAAAAGGAAKYFGERPAKATARGLSKALLLPGIRAIPGAKGVANRLAGLGARKEDVETYQKESFSNLTNNQFIKFGKRGLPVGPVAKAAFLNEASKRKVLNEITKEMADERKGEFLTELANAAKQTNPGVKPSSIESIKDILAFNPSLAARLTATRERDGTWTDEDKNFVADEKTIIAKFAAKVPGSEAAKLSSKTELNKFEVVANLSQSAITNIYRNGNDEQIRVLKQTLEDRLPPNLKGVAKKISEIRQTIRDAQASNDLKISDYQNTLKGLLNSKARELANATDEQKMAFEKIEFIAQKIGAEPF